jgi:hypothetical protein
MEKMLMRNGKILGLIVLSFLFSKLAYAATFDTITDTYNNYTHLSLDYAHDQVVEGASVFLTGFDSANGGAKGLAQTSNRATAIGTIDLGIELVAPTGLSSVEFSFIGDVYAMSTGPKTTSSSSFNFYFADDNWNKGGQFKSLGVIQMGEGTQDDNFIEQFDLSSGKIILEMRASVSTYDYESSGTAWFDPYFEVITPGAQILFDENIYSVNPNFPPLNNVPLPGGIWLLGSGLVGFLGLYRKYRK